MFKCDLFLMKKKCPSNFLNVMGDWCKGIARGGRRFEPPSQKPSSSPKPWTPKWNDTLYRVYGELPFLVPVSPPSPFPAPSFWKVWLRPRIDEKIFTKENLKLPMKKKNVIQPWHELWTECRTWDDETLFHHILCSSSLQLGLDFCIHRSLICYADMGA